MPINWDKVIKTNSRNNWDKVTNNWDKAIKASEGWVDTEYIDTGYTYPATTTTSTTATITTTGTTTSDWVTTYRPASPGSGWFVVDVDPACSPGTGTPVISYHPDPDPALPSLSDMDNYIALWPDQFHSEAEADLGIFVLTLFIERTVHGS